jgi:hypothetical protein
LLVYPKRLTELEAFPAELQRKKNRRIEAALDVPPEIWYGGVLFVRGRNVL